MPYLSVNGANLYYETFGKKVAGRAPVLLIHGSTGTGRSNWELAAPLLARKCHVIVPDCRGHGRSSNPQHSYSFKEMAADMAALIRGLGFRRAHVIGHSNGGNVALVTLMEHPDAVQTAILQAANAYVSPDLVQKEPGLFDPERVARESPAWMETMIELHGETHGADYWRELLRMTVKELTSEPNYSAEALGRVRRPTLVIQGERDAVNAPSRHAQFIAGHIPEAELWIPPEIGHSVHEEILFTWIDRVLDFLDRRGDDESDRIYRLGRRYGDARETIFQVRATHGSKEGKESLKLLGRVLIGTQRGAVLDLFQGRRVEDEIQILLDERTPWALANRSVCDLRREPHNRSERSSQILLGEAVRVLEGRGEWAQVRLENDGYIGWTQSAGLHACEGEEAAGYRQSSTFLVQAETAPAYLSPDDWEAEKPVEVGKVSFGMTLPVSERSEVMAAIRKPDGGRWWVADAALLPISERPRPDAGGVAYSLKLLRRFIGVPYLWGGRSAFGFDCSGLAQTYLGFLGIQIPRDSDQQFRAGWSIEGEFQPGDLLFFGEAGDEDYGPGDAAAPERPITHVAIYLGGDICLHANGSAWGVSYNSLDPASPLYRDWLKKNLAGGRRYL